MNENEPGGDQSQGPGREGKSGLSLPRDEAQGRRPTGARPRRSSGVYDRLRGAAEVNEAAVGRWFIPVVAILVLLFLVNIGMYVTQSNELAAWQREIATLRGQIDAARTDDPGARIEQLRSSMADLDARLATMETADVDLEAIQAELARQNEIIESLSSRMDELEQTPAPADSEADDTAGADESDPQSAGASGQSGDGQWVINLITVTDRASAARMQERLGNMDIDSRIETIDRDGTAMHRLVVPGYPTRDAAADAAPGLKDRLELPGDPWIARE